MEAFASSLGALSERYPTRCPHFPIVPSLHFRICPFHDGLGVLTDVFALAASNARSEPHTEAPARLGRESTAAALVCFAW